MTLIGNRLKHYKSRPISYPSFAAGAMCVEKWRKFAYQGEGYSKGPPMPGGDVQLSFHNESWDDPIEVEYPLETGQETEGPVAETSSVAGSEDASMLREQWQLMHGMNPPAWADRGFVGIKKTWPAGRPRLMGPERK